MLVGLGGNNGSTFTAGIIANRKNQTWETKQGIQHPNFNGSFTQSATAHVGYKFDEETKRL
jgi:myo-inositol-1-phosphate synthase